MKYVCREIVDIITFFQLVFKYYYDQNHKLIQLSERSWILLRLYRGYNILAIQNIERKLSQQFVKPIKVV